MSETLKQFMAALHHTDWNQFGVTIAGSRFPHAELAQILHELEEALEKSEKREWVGLTDEDIAEAGRLNVEGPRMLPYSFARAIEAKLKEKNT